MSKNPSATSVNDQPVGKHENAAKIVKAPPFAKRVKAATKPPPQAEPQPPAPAVEPGLRLPRVLARVEEVMYMEREGMFGQAPGLARKLEAIRQELANANGQDP